MGWLQGWLLSLNWSLQRAIIHGDGVDVGLCMESMGTREGGMCYLHTNRLRQPMAARRWRSGDVVFIPLINGRSNGVVHPATSFRDMSQSPPPHPPLLGRSHASLSPVVSHSLRPNLDHIQASPAGQWQARACCMVSKVKMLTTAAASPTLNTIIFVIAFVLDKQGNDYPSHSSIHSSWGWIEKMEMKRKGKSDRCVLPVVGTCP